MITTNPSNLIIPPYNPKLSSSSDTTNSTTVDNNNTSSPSDALALALPRVAMPQTPPMTPPAWSNLGQQGEGEISPAPSMDESIVTPLDPTQHQQFQGGGGGGGGRNGSFTVFEGNHDDGGALPGSSPQIGGLEDSAAAYSVNSQAGRKLADVMAGRRAEEVKANGGSVGGNVVDLSEEDELLFTGGVVGAGGAGSLGRNGYNNGSSQSTTRNHKPTFVDSDNEQDPSPSYYDTNEELNIPGSPFRPARTLSSTGMHMTSSGQQQYKRSSPPNQSSSFFQATGLPSPSLIPIPNLENGKLAYPSINNDNIKGQGTYAISEGCMTPSMLESGSNDGSQPGTPKSHHSGNMGLPSLPFQLNMGMNFGLGMSFPGASSFSNKNNKDNNNNDHAPPLKSKHSPAPSFSADRKPSFGTEKMKGWGGYLGGGGTGVKNAGMKGSGSEYRGKNGVGKVGFFHIALATSLTSLLTSVCLFPSCATSHLILQFYRPQPGVQDIPQTTAGLAIASLGAALTRIPRRVRPFLVAMFCIACVGSLVFNWAGQRSLEVERVSEQMGDRPSSNRQHVS